MLPLMGMVCNRLSSYLPCYVTVYGNGWQAVLPLMELRWGSPHESSSPRLWKWGNSRYQPFMETEKLLILSVYGSG